MREIWTPQELMLLKNGGDFRLMADVNMQGYTWEPVDFAGTLEISCGKTFVFNG